MRKLGLVLLAAAASAAAQTPLNDDPAGAVPLGDGVNPGAPAGAPEQRFSNAGATLTAALPHCAGTGGADVWFSYVATSGGPCVFATCVPAGYAAGSLADTTLEVFDATGPGGGPGVRVGCDDDACVSPGSSSAARVTALLGATYFVRVDAFAAGGVGSFHLTVVPSDGSAATTANADGCATTSAVLPSRLAGAAYADLTGAAPTPAATGCAAIVATDPDVWWTFTPPVGGTFFLNRELFDPSANNGGPEVAGATRLAVYDGATGCGVSTALLCGAAASGLSAFLVGGQTYLVRAANAAGAASLGACFLTWSLLPPPANDACAAAFAVVEGVNPAGGGAYSNAGATDDGGVPAPTCAAGAVGTKGVWFSYVATATGPATATTCAPPDRAPGSLGDTVLEVFASCGALAAAACGDDFCGGLSRVVFATTAGSVYRLRVSSRFAGVSGSFHLSVAQQPPDDECAGATPLALGPNGPFFQLGATPSGPAACSAQLDDRWFSFVAPKSGRLRFDTCGSNVDAVLSVHPACGLPALACNDDAPSGFGSCAVAQPNAAGIEFDAVGGTDYRLRVGVKNPAAFGDLRIGVAYRFGVRLVYDDPTDVLSLVVSDGGPFHLSLNAITLFQGAYPAGWFYGVDIPFLELATEIVTGAPFFVALDAAGGYSFSVPGVPAIGWTLYAVSAEYAPNGAPIGASLATSLTF